MPDDELVTAICDLLAQGAFDGKGYRKIRQALHAFKDTYNRIWIIELHGYRTPAQVRADQLGLAQAA